MKSIVVRICLLVGVLLLSPAVGWAQFTCTTNNSTITITQYSDDGFAGDVTIPDTIDGYRVTTIGPQAFYQCDSVTSITVGTNLTTIGTEAFYQCFELTTATLSASITNIGSAPFWDCQALTSLSLNPSNTFFTVTNGVLCNKSQTSLIQCPCGQGGTYTISGIVTNVNEAFIGNTLSSIQVNSTNAHYFSTNGVLCTKPPRILVSYPGGAVGSYTIPGIVTNINSAAFEYDLGITNVIIGTNVTGIGYVAFYDCPNMAAFTVSPTNAYYTSTNGALFDKHLTQLIEYPTAVGGSYVVPATVTNIADGAFGDDVGLTSVVVPDSVTSIGIQSFYFCTSLSGLSLGSSLGSIGQTAFFECPLTSVTIPDSVTNIGEFAFLGCTGLLSATFGTGLTSIGFEAFDSCYDLTNACFEGNEPLDGGSVFAFDQNLADISYVSGATGWGVSYDGIPTAPCTACAGSEPQLAIVHSGANVILTWPDNFTGFTLQSATNPFSSATWNTVSPAPADLSGLETVTNPASGARKFYRLFQ